MWPLYVGGFMGPFGGAMVNAMLPELAAGLGTSVGTAATAVTWYMIPFSTLMLVSGTVGARFGLARAIRIAFITYTVASAICVVATAPVPFLDGRMLQETANAFTTPLLLALIAELVPPQRLGRALGTYAACDAAEQAFAPFVGAVIILPNEAFSSFMAKAKQETHLVTELKVFCSFFTISNHSFLFL